MSRAVTLRPWQRDALEAFGRRRGADFLAVACPGAGKTTLALAVCRQYLGGEPKPVVVVVPTQHLKRQWAEAAARFGIHLDPLWTERTGLAADMHGIVTTYAQVATSGPALASLCAAGIVVLDEVHHAADDRTWGNSAKEAFVGASCRLLLSGTPFRTDDNPIPFVQYSFGDYGEALADYEYGYGEALRDGGVVRPVFFPRFDGHMEWRAADGEEHAATFNDDVTRDQWGARMRTALSLEGDWLPTVLGRAHERLLDVRRAHPIAGGLVVAIDHEHARGIARLLRRLTHNEVQIALSDDPKASRVIADFVESDEPWIVAVRMISEGVDIPRLRVGVFATTTATPMFFRQAVGRIARWTPGLRSQRAFMFLPDDPRLRLHALGIAQARRHSIELRREARDLEPGELDEQRVIERAEEQMSLFAALSSTALGVEEPPHDGIDPAEDLLPEPADARAFTIDLPPPPPLPGRLESLDGLPVSGTRRGEKTRLRDRNASLVSDIARVTSLGHRAVNAELNRLAGVVRIDDATVEQLHRRAEHGRRWIDDPGAFVVGRAPAPMPGRSMPRRVIDLSDDPPPAAEPTDPTEPTEPTEPVNGAPVVGSRFAELRRALARDD